MISEWDWKTISYTFSPQDITAHLPILHKRVRKTSLSAFRDVIRILVFAYWLWIEKNAVMSSSWVYWTVGISLNFPQAQYVLLFTETGIMSLSAPEERKNIVNMLNRVKCSVVLCLGVKCGKAHTVSERGRKSCFRFVLFISVPYFFALRTIFYERQLR